MDGRVWMSRDDGKKAMEFKRLDDPVLLIRRVFSCEENEEEIGNGSVITKSLEQI